MFGGADRVADGHGLGGEGCDGLPCFGVFVGVDGGFSFGYGCSVMLLLLVVWAARVCRAGGGLLLVEGAGHGEGPRVDHALVVAVGEVVQ
ncbi:hypothetical protein Srubr_02370 [Streptomyces rubradiris]|uniref:Uncharacterized protein n=1 Tax=Streptomyces rubradiris TaxID=285531 RepID=A0ABQ3R3F1_STRRR|nr:hypothetical protein GCM10018792_76100 [Streptomyces rubradiris]GHI50391.1 hypothetical protein Srubr_02370 [Streptomyces rubradiris]